MDWMGGVPNGHTQPGRRLVVDKVLAVLRDQLYRRDPQLEQLDATNQFQRIGRTDLRSDQ
jgi:hypothetical protein